MKRILNAVVILIALVVAAPAQQAADTSGIRAGLGVSGFSIRLFGGVPGLGYFDGKTWRSAPLYLSIAPTYTTIISTYVPASVSAIRLSGHGAIGDLGSGMPMVAGTATGPLAQKDLAGRWWDLDVKALPDIPIGYCGAVADDATDSTAAGQTCGAIANAAGKKLRIRTGGGTIRLGRPGPAPNNAGYWIRSDAGVVGDGPFLSYVRNMATDDNLFYVGNYTASHESGVAYLPAGSPYKSGATIVIDAGPSSPLSQNFFSVVEFNNFEGQRLPVYCKRANSPRIENNQFGDYSYAGVLLDNVDNVDNGDQVIAKNTFDAGAGGGNATAVLQVAAGGLRMSDNKVGRGAHAYQMALRQGVSTSILKIHDNSFENQGGTSVLIGLDPAATGASFLGTEVVDNEITGGPNGEPAVEIDGAGFLALMKVRGNRLVLVNKPNALGTKITGGVGLDYGGNTVHGFNQGAIALQLANGVSGTVDKDTLLGVPVALDNSSRQISLGTELTRVFPDVAYYAKSAEASLVSGYLTLPAFAVDMKAYTQALVEVDVDGFTQNFGGSLFRQRFAITTTTNGITVTPFTQDAAPALPGNTTSNQGFSVDSATSSTLDGNGGGYLTTTFRLHTNGAAGSVARARMRVVAGNAIFRSIQ